MKEYSSVIEMLSNMLFEAYNRIDELEKKLEDEPKRNQCIHGTPLEQRCDECMERFE